MLVYWVIGGAASAVPQGLLFIIAKRRLKRDSSALRRELGNVSARHASALSRHASALSRHESAIELNATRLASVEHTADLLWRGQPTVAPAEA